MVATAWVMHVDLDQFIAAVEVLRRPELAGLPVVVGGRGDPTERAVVSTASYEAREHGVHSGMPLRLAARKCPDAVFLPVDAPAYEAASEQVMATLRTLDAVVQVMGWDEAFLGVETDDPRGFAAGIRDAVLAATDLHCSVGAGDNKLRAKIATDFGKPRGYFELTEANWFEVMGARPTDALWGIGKRTAKRLAALDIHTVDDLAAADARFLAERLGPTMGPWYRRLARGVDTSPVDPTPYEPRGRSRETTYQQNLTEWADIEAAVRELAVALAGDLDTLGRSAQKLVLKVRYAPFFTQTRSRVQRPPVRTADEVAAAAQELVEKVDRDRAIRLLGLRAEFADDDG